MNKKDDAILYNAYQILLQEWCDALIKLQITEQKQPAFYGGILCPSCARVHGRCADAIYPLTYMADLTGDPVYLEAAKRLFDWAEHNMRRPDGSYLNDTNSSWRGITVFASIQIAEALLYHGHLLDEQTRVKWTRRLESEADFLMGFIDHAQTNVNYPITCAASMALANKVLNKPAYMQKARELARFGAEHITADLLLFGEGHPQDAYTPKGCRPVDLGYNVEETLPGLVTYALAAQDEEILQKTIESMHAHLAFMLPDGAWDNSWGTRSAKWTYWGSRTSDGCQIGYALLADREPVFGVAAERNFELYQRCTKDGLLYGGPMYVSANEPPCVHHTFCHAKALATMLDHPAKNPIHGVLPRETARGIRSFPSIHVSLLAEGPWRATVSDYDFDSIVSGHATGGALTMLWNEKSGPVCVATMTQYQLTEANNMQIPQYYENICQTPRIELEQDGKLYSNIQDKSAVMSCAEEGGIRVRAQGILRDGMQEGTVPFDVEYCIAQEVFTLTACAHKEAVFYLPVISARAERYALSPTGAVIYKEHTKVTLTCDTGISVDETIPLRSFNPVGGFETICFYTRMKPSEKTTWTMTVEAI